MALRIIYIDTDVYINYFKWESDRWRCLGELALMVFNRVLDGEFKLVISDHLLYELKKHVDSDKVDKFLKPFRDKGLLIEVKQTQEDIKEAKKISSHFTDPLHAILANNAKAEHLVTRNVRDYVKPCPDFIDIVNPEALP